jgi:hypothetical protein
VHFLDKKLSLYKYQNAIISKSCAKYTDRYKDKLLESVVIDVNCLGRRLNYSRHGIRDGIYRNKEIRVGLFSFKT